MQNVIKIALAEDHTAVRQGICSLLKKMKNFQVIYDVENGSDLLNHMQQDLPDIVLLDIDMPVMNGRQALQKITDKYPAVKVIMFTMHYDDFFVASFVQLGARAFLPKNCDFMEMVETLEAVSKHGFYYSARVTRVMASRFALNKRIPNTTQLNPFTEREIEILELLRLNKTNPEIAEILGIGIRTVEGHRQHLLQKTGCKNLAAVITFALANNLIMPTPIAAHN